MALTGLVYNATQVNDRELWRRSLAEAGLTLVDGSFEEGATANSKTDAVWYIAGGQCYTWDSTFPRDVPAKSTPATTGGVGLGAWVIVANPSTNFVFTDIGNLKNGVTIGGKAVDLSSVPEGTKVSWMGYYSQSDGGSNWGRVRFGAHVEDGGSIFSIDANTYVEANLKGGKVSNRKFGAIGNGEASRDIDTLVHQKWIDYGIANDVELRASIGDYALTRGLLVTFSNRESLIISGVGNAWKRYREPEGMKCARFFASSNAIWSDGDALISTNKPSLWFRTTLTLEKIQFVGDNDISDSVDTGVVNGVYSQVNTEIEKCGFYRCKIGTHLDSGGNSVTQSRYSKCSYAGIRADGGDSQYTNNFFDNMRRDEDDGTSYRGSAIYIAKGNNSNVTGGKIEACQKGVYLYRTQGINVSGINFDFNRNHILIASDLEEQAYIARSINIVGNRFLAAGNAFIRATNNTTQRSTINIVGNSFARGNSGAFDGNMTGLRPVGAYPDTNFMQFIQSGGKFGGFDVTFTGNNTLLASNSLSIFFDTPGTLTMDDFSDEFISVDNRQDGKVVRPAREFLLNAVPTYGTWRQGDVINLRFPTKNGTQQYICTLGGTFGGGTDPIFQANGILGAVKGEPATDITTLLTSLRNAGLIKT